MTRTTALLALGLLACTPGHPDTLGADTSSEASRETEETGDGDPPRGDGDGETTGATETGETGETGPGDGDGDGDGDEYPAACFVPGEMACYIPPFGVPPYGDECPPGEEDPCASGLKACTEPANLCMIVGEEEECPPGWIEVCE